MNLGAVVNSLFAEQAPGLSPDGLLLVFHGTRPGGLGGIDLWMTRRANRSAPWEPVVNLGPMINGPSDEGYPVLAPDGSALYFWRDCAGRAPIPLKAPILPMVDLDRDGKVGSGDRMLMDASWGTDDALCDVGPMAWGDGVLDEADLRVLMDHWGQEVNLSDPRQATAPTPSDQSISDVEQASPLRWMSGRCSAEHHVYISTDPVRVAEADLSDTTGIHRGSQKGSEYTLSDTLLPGQTLYWRIDEFNTDTRLTKGQVWSFCVANYLIVDDMEPYEPVWQRWMDGWDNPNNNGCSVDDNFTIVHTGKKSMSLLYDNRKAAISKVDRFWGTPQDWTRKGVDTLILWLHGSPDNIAEPLRVRLVDSGGGTAVIVHPDPAVLLSDGWQQWSIPFADVTKANLTAVHYLAIEIGDDTTKEGGTGKVYLDDICLSPVSR